MQKITNAERIRWAAHRLDQVAEGDRPNPVAGCLQPIHAVILKTDEKFLLFHTGARSCMPSKHESKSIPPSAFAVLRSIPCGPCHFSEDDFRRIEAAFLFKHLSAGEFLQRAGDIPRYAAFVTSGCLRRYVIDAKGKEHIVQFAPETWWLAGSVGLNSQTSSPYFIDAVENSDLLLIDGPSHQSIVEQNAAYSAAFRTGLQQPAANTPQGYASRKGALLGWVQPSLKSM